MSSKIVVEGWIAIDPTQRLSRDGQTQMLDIKIAESPRKLNRRTNEWERVTDGNGGELTIWHRATFFNEEAVYLSGILAKGMLVELSGNTRIQVYTDKQGNPQAEIEVHSAKIKLIPKPPKNDQSQYAPQGQDGWAAPSENGWPTT